MIIKYMYIKTFGYLVRMYYSENLKSIKPDITVQKKNTWANLIISIKVNFFMRQIWIILYKKEKGNN